MMAYEYCKNLMLANYRRIIYKLPLQELYPRGLMSPRNPAIYRELMKVFGALTVEGNPRLNFRFAEVFNGDSFLRFIQHLAHHYEGTKLHLIVDNVKYHHSRSICEWPELVSFSSFWSRGGHSGSSTSSSSTISTSLRAYSRTSGNTGFSPLISREYDSEPFTSRFRPACKFRAISSRSASGLVATPQPRGFPGVFFPHPPAGISASLMRAARQSSAGKKFLR